MKTKEIKIGDSLWHPCNMDVIEHKVTGIRQYEDFVQYETKSVRNIGASGKLELLLSHKGNKILFIGYVNGEDSIEYESGLQDFVEGHYYTNKLEAELVYYDQQRVLWWSNMDNKKRLYEEANHSYEKVKKLIEVIKDNLKNEQNQEKPDVLGQSEQLVCDYKYHNRDITTNGECTKCESHKWR